MAERHEDTRLLSELNDATPEKDALEEKRERMTGRLFPWVQWCDRDWRRADTGRIIERYMRSISNARTMQELNSLWDSFNLFRERLIKSRSQ